MQIDFHHAVTYVAARLAGFLHEDADVIAYAAQYVDDATCSGTVCFKNGAQYHRISTSHAMLDLNNFDESHNRQVWLPFHFLPGNGDLGADASPAGNFINKLICLHDSPIAMDMVRAAIADKGKPYGLHRFGVAMHVYADTWAHQGFAGVLHKVNDVENAVETDASNVFDGLKSFLKDVLDDAIPPLGHARANVLPDLPFLSWQYDDGCGNPVKRNNTESFCDAADKMCIAMKRYIAGDPDAEVSGIDAANKAEIERLFSSFQEKNGDMRHKQWLNEIRKGTFKKDGVPIAADLVYNDKGRNSWKAQALGTALELIAYDYNEEFLTSNWKMFHDAVQAHRFDVLHEILPKYGICAA